MKTIPLLNNDLASAIRGTAKLQIVLPPKDMKFDVALQVDDALYEKIKNDSYIADKIFADVSKLYKIAVSHLAKEAERIERDFFKKGMSKAWVAQEWQKSAPEILDKFEPILQAKAQAHLKQWQKVQGDANKYVIKCVFKVTVGSLGVATATLGTVVAFGAGGGAGGIAAIYGLYKAVLSLGKEINRLRKDIDQAEADLKGYIDSLLKTYKTKGKAKTVGREFVVEFLNQLSPKEVKSINGMNTAFDSFKGKLDRIEKKLSEMATKLNDLIDAQEVLQKDIDRKVKKELDNRDYTSKRLPTLNTKIAKMHTATAKKVAEVSEAIGKVADARKRETDYKKSIAALNGKKPDWASKLEKLITLGDLALGAGFTDFSKLDQILVLIDSVGVEIDNVLAEEV